MNQLIIPRNSTSTSATTPDSVAISATGNITIIACIAAYDYTPAATMQIVGQRNAGSGTDSGYALRFDTEGKLELYWGSGAGFVSGVTSTVSSVATGLADGSRKWIKATRVQSTGVVAFYLSDDGMIWTQLGANRTAGGTAAANNSAQALRIGCSSDGTEQFTGKIHYVAWYNDATLAALADFRSQALDARSFSDGTNTWTVNGSSEITGDGRDHRFLRNRMAGRFSR